MRSMSLARNVSKASPVSVIRVQFRAAHSCDQALLPAMASTIETSAALSASLMFGGPKTPRQLKRSTSTPCSFSVGASIPSCRSSEEIARRRSVPALTCSANSP
jgi:hypothetical protein